VPRKQRLDDADSTMCSGRGGRWSGGHRAVLQI